MPKVTPDDEGRKARKAAARPLPGKPTAPLIADGRPTEAGLRYVAALARHGGTQGFIASRLGLTAKAFKHLLADESDTATRLAWESGHAELETEVATILLNAARGGHVVAAIYFSKARLGWQESAPPPTGNVLQLILPRPLDAEQYAARLAERRAIEAEYTVVEPAPAALPPPTPADEAPPPAPSEPYEVTYQRNLQRGIRR